MVYVFRVFGVDENDRDSDCRMCYVHSCRRALFSASYQAGLFFVLETAMDAAILSYVLCRHLYVGFCLVGAWSLQ